MENKNKDSMGSASWKDYLRKKREQKHTTTEDIDTPIEIHLDILGMSCTQCEMRIEQALEKLPGVKKVHISYNSSSGRVVIDPGDVTGEIIIQTIEAMGYTASLRKSPGNEKIKAGVNKKNNDGFSLKQLIGIGIIIAALFLILNKTGVFNLVPRVNDSVGYGLLFVIGLLTSLHCVAMCGGINISQSVNKETCSTGNVMSQLKPGFLYNLGRLISYTVIGGIVGVIGSFVSFSGNVQGIIIIVAGSFMIIMGINMLDIVPFLRHLTIKPPKLISKTVNRLIKGKGPFIIGLLNGFMPCGPLQTMQLYALGTGSFIAGAFSMFLFSLGTIPLMFGISALGALLTKKFTQRMLKVSAILVFLLGIGMISRGLSLSGVAFDIIPEKIQNIATVEGTVQIIETNVAPSYYEPIGVQKGIPVKWNLMADEKSLNGCNNAIIIPKYNIRKKLNPGNNYIEFTPDSSGKVPFTCWMGMISSTILVVDDVNNVSDSAVNEIFEEATAKTGGSCCGSNGTSGCGTSGSAGNGLPSGTPGTLPDLNINTDSIGFAEIRDGIQYAYIDVTEDGYYPEVMVMQRGVVTEWVFRGNELDDKNYRMEFPSYRARIELKEGDNTISQFLPQSDFHYVSWKGDFTGFVSVVSDVENADKRAIEESVKSYIPVIPQSGGGCCGG